MPNWCHSKLTVTGDAEEVETFVKAVAADDHGEDGLNQPLDFAKVVPEPDYGEEEEEGELEANGDSTAVAVKVARELFPDWYSWRLQHWGTKWNANFGPPTVAIGQDTMEVPDSRTPIAEPGKAFYAFETAWSPPIPIVLALSEQHPELEIVLIWGEVGSDAAGRHKAVAGVMVEEEELEIEEALTPEEMWF